MSNHRHLGRWDHSKPLPEGSSATPRHRVAGRPRRSVNPSDLTRCRAACPLESGLPVETAVTRLAGAGHPPHRNSEPLATLAVAGAARCQYPPSARHPALLRFGVSWPARSLVGSHYQSGQPSHRRTATRRRSCPSRRTRGHHHPQT